MGDRGNIKIGNIYLYSHWGGSELGGILKNALSRKQRWDDEQYLTRIIFCEMIKDDVEGELGFGIGTEICDGDVRFEVDCEKQIVNGISFDEFIGD